MIATMPKPRPCIILALTKPLVRPELAHWLPTNEAQTLAESPFTGVPLVGAACFGAKRSTAGEVGL